MNLKAKILVTGEERPGAMEQSRQGAGAKLLNSKGKRKQWGRGHDLRFENEWRAGNTTFAMGKVDGNTPFLVLGSRL